MGKKAIGTLIFCAVLAFPVLILGQEPITEEEVVELSAAYREVITLLQEESAQLQNIIDSYEKEVVELKAHIEDKRKYNDELLDRLGSKKRGKFGWAWWGVTNVLQPILSTCIVFHAC